MKKILIIEDEVDLLDILHVTVESTYPDMQVTSCLTYLQALNALANQTFDLIISDQNLPDGSGGKIFQVIEESQKKIPFVLCSTVGPKDVPEIKDKKIYGYIQKPMILDPLKNILDRFRKEFADKDSQELSEYANIKTRLLIKTQPMHCDLFIQLSEKKYVKILCKGDIFDREDLKKYDLKKMSHLYIKRSDLDSFLDSTIKTILLAFSSPSIIPDDSKIEAINLSYHALQETFSVIGVTPAAKELAKTVSTRAIQIVSQNKNLALLLENLLNNEEEYPAKHSILLSALCTVFASAMPWFSDTISLKLSIAAFLHDITIVNPDLAKIDSAEELKENESKFSEKERTTYLTHTIDSAELARTIENIPPDIDNILIQHHEKPDGSGFPNHLLALRVSPLSALFIIAHHYTRSLLENKTLTIKQFLEKEKDFYSKGSFLTIFKELGGRF